LTGIYIHIPFCRQACNYCNFHFSTSLKNKNELVLALLIELDLVPETFLLLDRKDTIETIYFGGGTPSLLEIDDLKLILDKIKTRFIIANDAEITIEINPDDITKEKMQGWKEIGINRLSIGVQSFFEEDLQWMNRAHTSSQAIDNLQLAKQYFDNISIDLIYGTPLMTNEKWKQNVDIALAHTIPHLSCYALTVEPKTPLYKMILQHKKEDINSNNQAEQFLLLMQWMEDAGYEHYEISNFSKPGWRSRHNSSYWMGKKYLGIGPSAHSFNGTSRQWNISNNNIYIESINRGIIPFEKEVLTPVQQLNEYIMTSLRTTEGLNFDLVQETERYKLHTAAKKYIDSGKMTEENNYLKLTKEGKLFTDGIAADLFF
jgi:oxygen-independent coproporphyrinogen-3 oxidase